MKFERVAFSNLMPLVEHQEGHQTYLKYRLSNVQTFHWRPLGVHRLIEVKTENGC